MANFRVGDRVRLLCKYTSNYGYHGLIGTLVLGEHDRNEWGAWGVRMDIDEHNEYFDKSLNMHILNYSIYEQDSEYFNDDDITFELAQIKNNKLSRKLYPKARELGEWLEI